MSGIPDYVAVRGPCDLRCAWCNPTGTMVFGAASEIETAGRRLAELAKRGLRQVGLGLSRTEPTTHPDLPAIVGAAAGLGFEKITLATSGLRISDRRYLEELRSLGVTGVVLTFAGIHPLSDLLFGREGATEAKLQALSVCLEAGLEVFAILMFARPVLHGMDAAAERLGELVAGARASVHGCLMESTFDMDPKCFAALWPTFGEIASTMSKVRDRVPAFTLHARDIPSCVAAGIPGVCSLGGETAGGDFGGPTRQERPIGLCGACDRRACCPGISSGHLQARGASALVATPSEPPLPSRESLEAALHLLRGEAVGAAEQEEWRVVLSRSILNSSATADYEVRQVGLEPGRLRVALLAQGDLLELFVTRATAESRGFLRGERFCVSYTAATPLDADHKLRAARGLLRAIEES